MSLRFIENNEDYACSRAYFISIYSNNLKQLNKNDSQMQNQTLFKHFCLKRKIRNIYRKYIWRCSILLKVEHIFRLFISMAWPKMLPKDND